MAKEETESLQETPYLRLVRLFPRVFIHLARLQDTPHFVFFLIKPIDTLIFFQIYFYQETLHVSGGSSAHHQEFSTAHSALVYVIKLARHIPVPNVQWKTPDDGQRNCPKHVEFLDKNKFRKI